MADIDWIIHYVSEKACDVCHKEEVKTDDGIDYNGFPSFGNIHTHGLSQHNNQRELCLCIELPPDIAMTLLNSMGMRVANGDTVYTEGIRNDVLANGMDVQFISFDDDPTLYMILPDANGKLPMDKDCEEPYKYQEIYAKIISDNKDYV